MPILQSIYDFQIFPEYFSFCSWSTFYTIFYCFLNIKARCHDLGTQAPPWCHSVYLGATKTLLWQWSGKMYVNSSRLETTSLLVHIIIGIDTSIFGQNGVTFGLENLTIPLGFASGFCEIPQSKLMPLWSQSWNQFLWLSPLPWGNICHSDAVLLWYATRQTFEGGQWPLCRSQYLLYALHNHCVLCNIKWFLCTSVTTTIH